MVGRKKHCIAIILFVFIPLFQIYANPVDFQSSNLPILVINTSGQTIRDEPKIEAHLGIIYNGEGNRNFITDSFNEYDGFIGIEIRGYSSSGWSEKKPYGFETRDSLGANNNVSLLGLPKENDWVLHAPIADKSLMRNKLVYDLAREMGQYASRTRFCELVINGDYRGVYVLAEKIKQDNDRVDLEEPDELNSTGGYLLEFQLRDRVKDDETYFRTKKTGTYVVVKYPDEDDITTEQVDYIEDYFNEFESVLFGNNLADEENGYLKYIDVPSFIDHILLSECFHQLDALRSSQYFYKKKDGKLFMGPIWDCNRSMGNVKYYNIYEYDMWWMLNSRGDQRVPYVNQLITDPVFAKQYANRWFELRGGLLSNENILARIDGYANELDETKDRNFERWPDMLAHSYSQVYTFDSYEEAVMQVKDWVMNKFEWLDSAFEMDLDDVQNLAVNNIFNFSSQQEDPSNPASNAVDGNTSTRWSANNFPQWIEIDLKSDTPVNIFQVVPYEDRAYRYVIEGKSELNEEYQIIVDRTNNTQGGASIRDIVETINTRYIRLTVNGCHEYTGTWVSILEFKIFNKNSTGLVRENDSLIPKNPTLYHAYPNPFNPVTTIEYELLEPAKVTLIIYDMQGRQICTLVNEQKPAGLHHILWNATNRHGRKVSSGMYLYRIKVEGESLKSEHVRKMILLK